MPATPYTPTARLRADDPALPNCDAASVPTHRALLDAYAFERLTMVNRLLWSGDFSVDPGGTSSVFAVNVGGLAAVPLYDAASDAYLNFSAVPPPLGASKIEGGGALASDAWYFVYVWSNGGVLDYEISTTGPSASRVHKAGSGAALARVYLGCFPTDSSGKPVPLVAHRGRCVYLNSILPGVSNSQSDSAWHNVSLASAVPPHSRHAVVTVTMDPGANFRSIGDTSSSGSSTDQLTRPIVLDGSQRFEWNANGSARAIYASVHSFEE